MTDANYHSHFKGAVTELQGPLGCPRGEVVVRGQAFSLVELLSGLLGSFQPLHRLDRTLRN